MTHTISTNPPKVRYIVAGPILAPTWGTEWMIVDKEAPEGSKVVEYVEGRDEAVRRCAELNGDAWKLIEQCQKVLREYLPPDSGISPEECISRLLEILDGPEAQRPR